MLIPSTTQTSVTQADADEIVLNLAAEWHYHRAALIMHFAARDFVKKSATALVNAPQQIDIGETHDRMTMIESEIQAEVCGTSKGVLAVMEIVATKLADKLLDPEGLIGSGGDTLGLVNFSRDAFAYSPRLELYRAGDERLVDALKRERE